MRPRKPDWGFKDRGVLTQGRRFRLIWKYVFRELFVVQYHGRFPEFFIEECVLNAVPCDILKKQVIDILFERDYTIFD